MKGPAWDEVRLFSDARPDVADYPSDARARAQARLLEAAQAEKAAAQETAEQAARSAATARRRVGRARWRIVAGTLAVAAVAGLVATVTWSAVAGSPARRPSPTAGSPVPRAFPAATGVLELAAAIAARQSATPIPGPGHYLYLRDIEFKWAGGPGATSFAIECAAIAGQEWMAYDGAGRQTGTYPSPKCQEPGFVQAWPKSDAPNDDPTSWPLNLVGWQGLPTSPAALKQAIVRRFENGATHYFANHAAHDIATFAYAAAFLQEDAPPAVRAALFRVIEGLPGVKNLGPTTDHLGRRGLGVGLDQGGSRQELIFNPATSRALEEEIVAVGAPQSGNNDQPAGTVLGYTVYVTSGVVGSDTATLPAFPGLPSAGT
jgi:hypothetical protein